MHPELLASVGNLVTQYIERGHYAKAQPLCKECLKLRNAKLGDSHPAPLDSIKKLANLYEAQGDYAKAEALLRGVPEAV
jgi:tetratricopeptide (TPR) repeat protein